MNATLSESDISAALKTVVDPELRAPITELNMIDFIRVTATLIEVGVRLTIVGCPASERIKTDTLRALQKIADGREVQVTLSVMTTQQRSALTERLTGGRSRVNPFGPGTLTRVIAVTSGKGGVGKSTITANLAVSLAEQGYRVGLIDADIHGFSIPTLLGLVDDYGRPPKPTRIDQLILPPISYGVKVISIGMFLPETKGRAGASAVAWRGPMLHRTLNQFLSEVYFGDLDFLFLDMPPGTGDVAISMGQLLPNAEVLVVTTPQTAAVDVAERSGTLARQSGQKIVGVIENMAGFQLPDGSEIELFGSAGGALLAERLSVAAPEAAKVLVLASVPITLQLRESGDRGTPVVLDSPDDPAALAIRQAAMSLAAQGRNLPG